MNVENRKLFANRDARKRLAEMGGILASSPELMGEAMKFANGGQAQEQEFIINIPGLTIPGEMLRIKESTLMQLGNMFPDLMGQQNALVQPVELMGAEAMNARPGDAVIGTRISRMMQQSAPEEVVLESAPITSGEQPSLMDRIRTTVQSAQSVNPIEDAFKEIGPAITSAVPGLSQYEGQPNPYVEALKNAGLSEDALLTGSEDLISMGPMAGPIYPAEERSFNGPEQKLLNAMNPAFDSFGGDLLARNSDAKDLMAGPIYPAEERSSTSKLSSMDFSTDPTKGYPFPTDVPKDDPKYEAQSVVEAMTKSSNPAELEAQLEAIQDRKAEARRSQEMADAEREQMTGMPDLAAPEKVDVDVLLDAVEKNDPKAASAALMKSITGVDVHGGTTPPPSDDTPDAPKPDAPKTRKQRMLETVDMISEMFGIREKDKAEDMYDLMATIGFAMASGESPNAMKNIADAFLVGAQMKRADKKEAKADERAIQKLAFQTIQDQDATDAEQKAARDLLKEKYGYLEDLEILKADLNPASPTAKPPSLQKAILDAIGDAAQAKTAALTEDEIQKVTDMVIRLYEGNYQTGTDSGKTPGQVQSLKDIP
jgi:hypothetical protein